MTMPTKRGQKSQACGPFKNLVMKDTQDGNLALSPQPGKESCVVEGFLKCQCPVANHAQRMGALLLEACKGDVAALPAVGCQPAAFAGAKDGGIELLSLFKSGCHAAVFCIADRWLLWQPSASLQPFAAPKPSCRLPTYSTWERCLLNLLKGPL